MQFPKAGRVKLSHAQYRKFRQQIFALDRYQCLVCGRRDLLSIEHHIPRSFLRLDTQENCYTCCVPCNQAIKDRRLRVHFDAVERKVYPAS